MNTDVIVIGVGGMGAATCLALAKSGLSVLGIEQFSLGHSQGSSHGESRIIRKAYFEHSGYVPLLNRVYELWKDIELESESTLYQQTGLIYYGNSKSTLIQGILNSAQKHSLEVKRLNREERKNFSQFFYEEKFEEALFEPQAGLLYVEDCVRAQLQLAKRYGVQLIESEAVQSWKINSETATVKTNRAEYRAKSLVFTAGAWMGQLLTEMNLPLKVLKKTVCWLPSPKNFYLENGAPCYLIEKPEGVFYGFPSINEEGERQIKIAEHSGGISVKDPTNLDRTLSPEDQEKLLSFAQSTLKGVQTKIERFSTCMYTSTPDENFILDFHPRFSNVVIASCCSGHGFKFSPMIGEAIKDLVVNGETQLPIDFLRLRNF